MKKLLILAVSLALLASLVFAADIFGAVPKDPALSSGGSDETLLSGGATNTALLSYPGPFAFEPGNGGCEPGNGGRIYVEGEDGAPVKYPVGGLRIDLGEDGNAKIKNPTTLGLKLML
jgi:opacity protein-like surface antigen